MMWAATVRRCPTGQTRHPSQFGARLQLARALNHAPYLICDSAYHFPSPHHTYGTQETGEEGLRNDYYIVPPDQTDCNITNNGFNGNNGDRLRSVLSCYRSRTSLTYDNCNENGYRRNSLGSNFTHGISPAHTREGSSVSDSDVRVELSYSRREFHSEDYLSGEHIVRRYDNFAENNMGSRDEDNVVSLSYQQQSLGGSTIYDQEVWGNDLFMDCWDNRRFLIEKGVYREAVKFLCILALSLALIFFVAIGFGVHNILVTGIFLVLLLSTVLMAIFLLMRKPACSLCTEPVDMPGHTSVSSHRGCPNYISDGSGVIKKNSSDSPPPYEFPPDYESLPPELLVSAISLQEMNSVPDSANHHKTIINKSNSSQQTARRFLFRSREPVSKDSSITCHGSSTVSSATSLAHDQKYSGESSTPLIISPRENSDKLSIKDTGKITPTYDCVIKISDKANPPPSKTKP